MNDHAYDSLNPQKKLSVSDPKDATFPHYAYPDDEISLVDLIKILIRRKWWCFVTAAVIFLAAIVYTLLLPQKEPVYQVMTTYQMALRTHVQTGEAVTPFENPNDLIQKIQQQLWPQVLDRYRSDHPDQPVSIGLQVTNPRNSWLIQLVSHVSAGQLETAKVLHEKLLTALTADRVLGVELIAQQLSNARDMLTTLISHETEVAAYTASAYATRVFELENWLSAYQSDQIIQLARQSVVPPKLGSHLILALALVLGGMLGIMAAFFAEFAARVRTSLQEDSQNSTLESFPTE